MQKIGSLMLDAGKYLGTNGKSLVEKLVDNAKTAKIDDVADAFANLYNTAKEKATELGGSVADIFVKFFSQKPEKIGEELGNTMGGTVGSIAFDALLGVVTAGAAAAAKTALTSARAVVQPLLNLLIRTGQKAKLAVQGVWSYAKRITASARTGILTWIKKVSAELGAKAHAIIESIENFVERLLVRAKKAEKVEAEIASELAEQKSVQLLPAIAEAKVITAAHEKAGAPIHVLLTTLSALRKRFRWIKGFHAEGSRLVPGHKRIVMLASEHEIDADYDPEKEGKGRAIDSNQDSAIAHKMQRWEEYKDRGGNLTYEKWSNVNDANQTRALKANAAVDAFHQRIGWGKREVSVDVEGVQRRLDIADIDGMRAIEYKSGIQSASQENLWEIARDEIMIQKGWDLHWQFEKMPSGPLRAALDKAHIPYIIGY